jgi:S-adenosylmethionine/arginine decarboxylase-like enzyme
VNRRGEKMLEHRHLIIRAEVRNPPTCPEYIKKWLVDVISSIGMKLASGLEANPIAYYCDLPGNEGLTGAAILETSHSVIHIWDSDSPAIIQYDLYSCSDIDLDVIFAQLEQFEPFKIEYKFFDRDHGLTLVVEGNR